MGLSEIGNIGNAGVELSRSSGEYGRENDDGILSSTYSIVRDRHPVAPLVAVPEEKRQLTSPAG
jgi:hypothetical protein